MYWPNFAGAHVLVLADVHGGVTLTILLMYANKSNTVQAVYAELDGGERETCRRHENALKHSTALEVAAAAMARDVRERAREGERGLARRARIHRGVERRRLARQNEEA